MATHSASQDRRLLVFARYPEPGLAKTRLIPALGPDRASRLHAALTRRTLRVAQQFCSRQSSDLDVYFTGGDAARMQQEFGCARYLFQSEGDLGERLLNAAARAFSEGAVRIVVVGTDCPDLSPEILEEAFAALQSVDLVLGPAMDGGYFLIGLRSPQPDIFHRIDWGTDRVLQQTLDRARQLQLSVHQLSPLSDVDEPADLIVCRRVTSGFDQILPGIRPGMLSVVIPTLNEEGVIERTLQQFVDLENVEVIVADGGSSDATPEIVRRTKFVLLPVNSGRGRQMNAGASVASGEALLFLHADTRLPDRFQELVWSTLASGAIAGAFRLSVDQSGWGLRLIEWGVNQRTQVFQSPYGDQALFLRADTFFTLGGFPNWKLMEDYEFCRRLRVLGRIQLVNAAVTTSARRWKKLGLWRTTLRNQMCVAGYHLGVSPDKLARFYYR